MIREAIKKILQRKEEEFKRKVESGEIKLRVPVEDYINEHGIRVRRYEWIRNSRKFFVGSYINGCFNWTNIKMKITLEQHGDKISIETEGDDHSATEFIDYICQLMMCAGYHYESVKQAIYGKAEEYEYEDKGCD